MKRIILLTVLASLGLIKISSAQGVKVKWYSFEEAVELNKNEQRKIFIDVYTDWCGWCKKMDATTFSNPTIAEILNKEYYAVKFNAEQKDSITFQGHTFKFIPSGGRGYHELAAALLRNKLSYPSLAYLNEQNELITPWPGYKTPVELEVILKFIADDAFLSQTLEEFQKSYKAGNKTN